MLISLPNTERSTLHAACSACPYSQYVTFQIYMYHELSKYPILQWENLSTNNMGPPPKNITLTCPELLQIARLRPFFQAAFQEGDLHVVQKACIAQGDSNQSTSLYIISAHTSFHTVKVKTQSLTYVHTCTTTNQYTLATNLLAPMTQLSVV